MKGREEDDAFVQQDRRSRKRIAVIAWSGSLLLHAAFIFTALLITLQSPDKHDAAVSVDFLRPSPRNSQAKLNNPGPAAEAASRRSTQQQRDREAAPEKPRIAPNIPTTLVLPDISTSGDVIDADSPRRMKIPRSPLEREMTSEQAYAELNRLLEEYPQFRDQIMRKLVAGSGMTPDTVPKFDLRLEQMLANGIKPSWNNQRHRVEAANQSFNGVSGWTQNSYGGGINVLGLLGLLYDLIKGEEKGK